MNVEFRVYVKNLGGLTVGGGSSLGASDITLNPLILPPSSLKGALRTAITKYLPQGYTSCNEINPERIKIAHKNGPCDVCRLFGYPDSLENCLTIVKVDGEEKKEKKKKFVLTRVSIDDSTQIAKEGSLFSQEEILPTEFEFLVRFRCDEKLLKLLLYSFLALRYWRLGRNTMVDVKIEDFCTKIKCSEDIKSLVDLLKDYMW